MFLIHFNSSEIKMHFLNNDIPQTQVAYPDTKKVCIYIFQSSRGTSNLRSIPTLQGLPMCPPPAPSSPVLSPFSPCLHSLLLFVLQLSLWVTVSERRAHWKHLGRFSGILASFPVRTQGRHSQGGIADRDLCWTAGDKFSPGRELADSQGKLERERL